MCNERVKPFLRWAGGKNWLRKEIHKFIPRYFNNYHEPFLGGASVFFFIKPPGKSFLSDSNENLVNTYCEIRDNVNEVIRALKCFKNTKEDYYSIRNEFFESSAEKAAKFIYLNRTGFNGIYRVNTKGEYNVPYGHKEYKKLFDFDLLRNVSLILQNVKLSHCDFEVTIKKIKKNDLVFLDPPYTITGNKNGFIKYNKKLFSYEDQIRLATYISELVKKEAFYILTNAFHPEIKKLFGKVDKPLIVTRANVIGGSNAKRGTIKEYIFTNTLLRRK